MLYQEFIYEMRRRSGLPEEEAIRAADATFETLGERLDQIEADMLASFLPAPLVEALRRRGYDREFSVGEFFARVERREGVPLSFAIEHATAACQILSAYLPESLRARLGQHLPESFIALFTPQPELPAPEPLRRLEGESPEGRRTLSEGRPGSQHPLSEAHPDTSQSGSVVRANNPHQETKLSSSQGLLQERQEETLASGKHR